MFLKRLGKGPGKNWKERMQGAVNYRNGKFHNVEPTAVNPNNVSIFKILKAVINKPSTVVPPVQLPVIKTNLHKLESDGPVVVWFGHSSYFLKYLGFTILVDPVFSGNASPFKFFGSSFTGTDIFTAADFPEIDLLIITHDHYDHLDYPFIKQIAGKVKKVVTAIGVGSHLELWGINENIIHEMAWGEKIPVNNDLDITALPARHFSGRSFSRFNTLWASFALQWGTYKIYIGSDSGYSKEFERIGNEFGKFDLAFLECGQYNSYWPQIHMFPEETVQAARDLKAEILFPVHWGKFVLSTHPWNESVIRVTKEAEKKEQKYIIPKIGEAWYLGKAYDQEQWWNI